MMTKTDLLIAELQFKIDDAVKAIQMVERKIRTEKHIETLPEWVTLDQAVKTKGGAALATYRCRPCLLPCGGTNFKRIGGRKVWNRNDVLEWLSITDDELPSYIKKYGVKFDR